MTTSWDELCDAVAAILYPHDGRVLTMARAKQILQETVDLVRAREERTAADHASAFYCQSRECSCLLEYSPLCGYCFPDEDSDSTSDCTHGEWYFDRTVYACGAFGCLDEGDARMHNCCMECGATSCWIQQEGLEGLEKQARELWGELAERERAERAVTPAKFSL